MLDKFLIVNKEILPEVFSKVMEVKKMMESGEYQQVSEAVKQVGLSRSAYYKYKDFVFEAATNTRERKAVISFMLSHQKGVLSEVLNIITSLHCNILTINQNIPIHNKASVSVSIDISEMSSDLDDLLTRIAENNGVSKVHLTSLE